MEFTIFLFLFVSLLDYNCKLKNVLIAKANESQNIMKSYFQVSKIV